jgi:uncharacterized protein YaeQ
VAQKAAVHKAELEVVDMDRHHYHTYRLTAARHPSETQDRLMVRLLAFALNAHERLEFGRGISEAEEPDLWIRDLAGAVVLWIELGHPEERVLARALGRSARVVVYTYSPRPSLWWDPLAGRFGGEARLSVFHVSARSAAELGALAAPTMSLQVSVQEGDVWVRDDTGAAVQVEVVHAPPPAP